MFLDWSVVLQQKVVRSFSFPPYFCSIKSWCSLVCKWKLWNHLPPACCCEWLTSVFTEAGLHVPLSCPKNHSINFHWSWFLCHALKCSFSPFLSRQGPRSFSGTWCVSGKVEQLEGSCVIGLLEGWWRSLNASSFLTWWENLKGGSWFTKIMTGWKKVHNYSMP